MSVLWDEFSPLPQMRPLTDSLALSPNESPNRSRWRQSVRAKRAALLWQGEIMLHLQVQFSFSNPIIKIVVSL